MVYTGEGELWTQTHEQECLFFSAKNVYFLRITVTYGGIGRMDVILFSTRELNKYYAEDELQLQPHAVNLPYHANYLGLSLQFRVKTLEQYFELCSTVVSTWLNPENILGLYCIAKASTIVLAYVNEHYWVHKNLTANNII